MEDERPRPHILSWSAPGGQKAGEDWSDVRTRLDDEKRIVIVMALADGMGGQSGGARAAQVAVGATMKAAFEKSQDLLERDGWAAVLKSADKAVKRDKGAGYTTLIGLSIRENQVVGGSCGDSAVLALDASGKALELTRGQAKYPPVGSGEAAFVPFAAKLEPPWTLLAMSDGVWKYVGWERIIESAKTLREDDLVDALQKAARMKGSGQFQDDFTLVVIHDEF